MDLNKYKDEIFELRKFHSHDRLELFITKKIPNLNARQLFDIKMEIKRLANVISKSIDLRYVLTDSASIEFKFDNKVHFLDQRAIDLFKFELKIYENIFTVGVFERVLFDAKDRLKESRYKEEVNTINFTKRNQRDEERMNFNVKLNMYLLEDQSPIGLKSFIKSPSGKKTSTVSLNISEQGLKIKTRKDINIDLQEIVFIEFKKEQLEYNDESYYIPYQVVKITNDKASQDLALQRITDVPNFKFNRDLSKLINDKKGQYKVELTNIVEVAKAKSYEQSYMESLQTLPLYYDEHSLKYAFSAGKNDVLSRYFEDETGKNVLINVLDSLDIPMPEGDITKVSINFMIFKIEKNNKVHFFAKSLASPNIDLLKLFSVYGARRKTFRIFKLDLNLIEEKEYILKNTLPKEVLKHVNFSNHFLTKESENKLSKIKTIGLLTNITDEDYKIDITKINLSDTSVKELTKYQVNLNQVKEFEIIEDESKEIRKEDRFEMKEIITFKHKRLNYMANIQNISVNGMRIELQRYSPIHVGEKLIISFKDKNDKELKNIPYRVVHGFDNTLSLKLLKDEAENSPEEYFENHIRNNIENLTVVGFKNKIIGLSKGLRNIYIQNHLETPCFFKVHKGTIKEYTIANSKLTKTIFNKFNKNNDNIQKALYSEDFKNNILKVYNQINYNQSHTFKYFVKMFSDKGFVMFKEESEFNNTTEKKDFLTLGDSSKTFCFKITLSKTKGNLADKYFRDEIAYIEKHSDLKAKEIINEVEQISGILHIQNITKMKISQLDILL